MYHNLKLVTCTVAARAGATTVEFHYLTEFQVKQALFLFVTKVTAMILSALAELYCGCWERDECRHYC